jgi:hypothetical protein
MAERGKVSYSKGSRGELMLKCGLGHDQRRGEAGVGKRDGSDERSSLEGFGNGVGVLGLKAVSTDGKALLW